MGNKDNEKKVAPKGANGWITLTKWAENHGVSVAAVSKAADAGRLEDNGRRGRGRRVRGELIDASPAAKDLLTLKTEKLAADIKLTEQRLAERRREWETVMAEKTISAFAVGFTPFKIRLAELRLGAKETSELNDLFDVCVAGFELELRKAVKEGRE